MRLLHVAFALVGLFLVTAAALGLGADHPKGPLPRGEKWPDGLLELVNRPDRVHGFFVNWEDVYFYSGETKALNEFLDGYAKLPNTALRVVLHLGPRKARSPWDESDRDQAVEWRLYTAGQKSDGKYHTEVHGYLGGRIKLADLKVPAGVTVESGGEIERFVSEHTKKK